jgi:hypothetical protein
MKETDRLVEIDKEMRIRKFRRAKIGDIHRNWREYYARRKNMSFLQLAASDNG